MWLKFHQPFSELYKDKAKNPPARCYVYVADGRTAHGGLSDRLKGLISIYEYCKDRNIPLRINFYSPFNLDLFLVPNKYDWRLKGGEFVRNNSVGFRFLIHTRNSTKRKPFTLNFLTLTRGKFIVTQM